MQDRIIRTSALEKLSTLEEIRPVLREEVDRYNNHQVHSTTKEIPAVRFAKAIAAGNSLFRPFALAKPYTSPKDIFCLRERRTVNGYRRISLSGHQIQVPNVPLYEAVEVHMVPNIEKQAMDLRLWWNQELVHYLSLPMQSFSVHL